MAEQRDLYGYKPEQWEELHKQVARLSREAAALQRETAKLEVPSVRPEAAPCLESIAHCGSAIAALRDSAWALMRVSRVAAEQSFRAAPEAYRNKILEETARAQVSYRAGER